MLDFVYDSADKGVILLRHDRKLRYLYRALRLINLNAKHYIRPVAIFGRDLVIYRSNRQCVDIYVDPFLCKENKISQKICSQFSIVFDKVVCLAYTAIVVKVVLDKRMFSLFCQAFVLIFGIHVLLLGPIVIDKGGLVFRVIVHNLPYFLRDYKF